MLNAVAVNPDEQLTTSGVARELGVAEGTVRLMARRGELPAVRLSSGMRIFRRADVDRLREQRIGRRG
jgi:excisionase family DNA binding protein